MIPWVMQPTPPLNGRAAAGNKVAYLSWDPPAWDGGRAISEYLLQVSHVMGKGLGSWRPVLRSGIRVFVGL